MEYKIVHLPKEKWKGKRLLVEDTNKYNYSETLYDEKFKDTCAWGSLNKDELIATIETYSEEKIEYLRIIKLWIDISYQNQGLGKALVNVAKEQAIIENKQAIIVEIPHCNEDTINFFLHEGFTLINVKSSYDNKEIIQRRNITELRWILERKKKLSRQDIEIRQENPENDYEVELMLQKAFWNKFRKGCNNHLMVHKLRKSDEYIPELSRIALKDGEIIGVIFYSRAFVQDGNKRHEVLTFGPLGVSKQWRGCGIGKMLLQETMKIATEKGFRAIIILGAPEYYPRVGFKTCDHFGITTKYGENFDAFLGIELIPNGLKNIHGKFYQLLENISPEEIEEYNKKFPPLEKQYFPSQLF
jgi:predicted N-acetyltransferase YhbS